MYESTRPLSSVSVGGRFHFFDQLALSRSISAVDTTIILSERVSSSLFTIEKRTKIIAPMIRKCRRGSLCHFFIHYLLFSFQQQISNNKKRSLNAGAGDFAPAQSFIRNSIFVFLILLPHAVYQNHDAVTHRLNR